MIADSYLYLCFFGNEKFDAFIHFRKFYVVELQNITTNIFVITAKKLSVWSIRISLKNWLIFPLFLNLQKKNVHVFDHFYMQRWWYWLRKPNSTSNSNLVHIVCPTSIRIRVEYAVGVVRIRHWIWSQLPQTLWPMSYFNQPHCTRVGSKCAMKFFVNKRNSFDNNMQTIALITASIIEY